MLRCAPAAQLPCGRVTTSLVCGARTSCGKPQSSASASLAASDGSLHGAAVTTQGRGRHAGWLHRMLLLEEQLGCTLRRWLVLSLCGCAHWVMVTCLRAKRTVVGRAAGHMRAGHVGRQNGRPEQERTGGQPAGPLIRGSRGSRSACALGRPHSPRRRSEPAATPRRPRAAGRSATPVRAERGFQVAPSEQHAAGGQTSSAEPAADLRTMKGNATAHRGFTSRICVAADHRNQPK